MILNEKIFVLYNGTIESFKQLENINSYDKKIVFIKGDNYNSAIYTQGKFYKNIEELVLKIHYNDLKELINSNSLIPGMKYRIIDYVTIIDPLYHAAEKGVIITSANHPFDLIVTATSSNTLDCNAQAVLREDDLYFMNSELHKWKIKYNVDNGFSQNKGIIYYMKDQNGNEAPYDFKNIQFTFTENYSKQIPNELQYNTPYYTFTLLTKGVNKYNTQDVRDTENFFVGDCSIANLIFLRALDGTTTGFGSEKNNTIKIVDYGTTQSKINTIFISIFDANKSYYEQTMPSFHITVESKNTFITTCLNSIIKAEGIHKNLQNKIVQKNSQGDIKTFNLADTINNSIVQNKGNSTKDVMSQEAVTRELNSINDIISSIRDEEKPLLIDITYEELFDLCVRENLVPGMQYRITDYTYAKQDGSLTFVGDFIRDNISTEDTITVNYRGKGYMFDLIITADSNNSINAEARVVQHEYAEGETPDILINRDFSKWKVKYDVENNTDKYEWADTDGKGVIYELEDEFGNRCPYDFVNIEYALLPNEYYPTFSAIGESGNVHHNIIEPYIKDGVHRLNAITIEAMSCFNNKFGNNCYLITNTGSGSPYFKNNEVKDTCYNASFGRNAKNITINANCSNWSIGDNCYSINIGVNNDNWNIGNSSHDINTGSFNLGWEIKSYCCYITTGNHCSLWHCNNATSSWTAGNGCGLFTISSGAEEDPNITDYENYWGNVHITIEDGASYFESINRQNCTIYCIGEDGLDVRFVENSNIVTSEQSEIFDISCDDIVNLIRNQSLCPGRQYNIKDYRTFYLKDEYPNMCEVDKLIPIIVTADTEDSINPYARVRNGSAIIRVQLYDEYRFPKREAQITVLGSSYIIEDQTKTVLYNDVRYVEMVLRDPNNSDLDHRDYFYTEKTELDKIMSKNRYIEDAYSISLYIAVADNNSSSIQFDSTDDAYKLSLLGEGRYLPEIPESRGAGEILWMRDYAGNEAPFDFQNVRWYFTEEEINNFDNRVTENGVKITGLAQYFTPDTPTPTFKGDCNNNVITFEVGIAPIIIQNSRCNKIFVERNSPKVTLVNNSYYSELHSRYSNYIYPFLQQQYCYSEVLFSTLYKCPYLPSNELGNSDSLTVSQKTITEAFDGVNKKITDSKEIIPFAGFESVTSAINDDSPDDTGGMVIYDTNLNTFLYKIDGAYYRNWHNKDMYIRDNKLIDDKIYSYKDFGVLCAVKFTLPNNYVLTPISQNPVGRHISMIFPNSRIIRNSVNDTELNFTLLDDFYNQNYTSEIDIYFDKNYTELPPVAFPDVIQWNKTPTFIIGKHYSIIIECIIINDVKHYSGVWTVFDY